MKDKKVLLVLMFTLIIGVAASAYVCYWRINVEGDNRVAELAIDFSDVERLATFSGIGINEVLAGLRSSGATSVALTEDLAGSTDVNFLSGVDPKKIDLYVASKGFSAWKIGIIRGAGLRVIPRSRNIFSQDERTISSKLAEISDFDTVIFAEEEVLGYPNHLKVVADGLASRNIRYGYIEFGKQLGDSGLSSYSGTNIVKVHSIAMDEMENLKVAEMTERFMRAVRERNIRLLYVHLLQYPDRGMSLLETNQAFIDRISASLVIAGFSLGRASGPSDMKVGPGAKALIGLGVGSGIVLILSYFMHVDLVYCLIIIMLASLIPSVKMLALISAIVFPVYAVISAFPAKRNTLRAGLMSDVILNVCSIAGITLLGGVFIAALLVGPKFMLGVDSFSGVKIAFVLPVMIIAGYFFLRDEHGAIDLKNSIAKLEELMSIKVTFLHVAVLAAAAAAAAIMILRSGNFGLPVPGFEKFARALLENSLSIRPRTKEFLIGYPALVIASFYYFRGHSRWLWLFLAAGTLAPVTLINSFCHTHTPLMISITRSCIGLVLGIAIGLAVYGAYLAGLKLYHKLAK